MPPSRPQAPRWYRAANILICGVGAWPVLLGIAAIDHAPTRTAAAIAIAAAATVIAAWFDRAVNGACARSALGAVEHITAEARRRQGGAVAASPETTAGAPPPRGKTAQSPLGAD